MLQRLVKQLVDKAKSNGETRIPLLKLARAAIEDAIFDAHLNMGMGTPLKAETYLDPVLRAIAHLPVEERGGCIRHISATFNGVAPAEYYLGKKIEAYAHQLAHENSDLPTSIEALDVGSLLSKDVQMQERILGPWLVEKSICMVHAWRGTGKSLFVVAAALAIANGTPFLGWNGPRAPRRVLLVDGELPEPVLQQRMRHLIGPSASPPAAEYFRLVYLDIQPSRQIPNLADEAAQSKITELMADYDVLILDNLSCLVHSGKENESESWAPMRRWLVQLRSSGKSVIIVHHSGKGGKQRGTSAREDILDTVINLKRAEGVRDEVAGAVFEVHFEKARHFWGADAEPFLAALDAVSGEWSREPILNEPDLRRRIQELKRDGNTRAEIARQLSVNRSTVGRNWE